MTLRHRFDEFGTLWFENPVATGFRRMPVAAGLLAGVTGGLWALTAVGVDPLGFGAWASGFCYTAALPLVLASAVYSVFRFAHPIHPDAPRRVGFSPLELHTEDGTGQRERFRWPDIDRIDVGRAAPLVAAVTLVIGEKITTLRFVHMTLVAKIRFSRSAVERGRLDLDALAGDLWRESTLTSLPEGGERLNGAVPDLYLFPDEVIAWDDGRGVTIRRPELDVFPFMVLGKERMVVCARGQDVAAFFNVSDAKRLLDWIRDRPLPGRDRAW